LITLIKSIMLIIFAINFNKKLASYLRLTSITKIVNEMQGLGTNVVVFADVGNNEIMLIN